MASNVDIKLMAGLDIDSSIPQIKDDIAQIQKKLEAAGIKINLVAEIDEQLKDTAYVPDRSWMKSMYPSTTVNTKPNVVNVSVGDVKLTDVRDVDGFAKAMGRDFVPLARQALARF